MQKEDEVLQVVNLMLENSEPIKACEFNHIAACTEKLLELEGKDGRIGLRLVYSMVPPQRYGISTMSLIATITDVLVGKRLAFEVDDETGIIQKVVWYVPPVVKGDESRES